MEHQEEEDGQEQEQGLEEEASSEEDDDQGDIPAVWMRGPARLPNRLIPLEQRPIIRPDGKR